MKSLAAALLAAALAGCAAEETAGPACRSLSTGELGAVTAGAQAALDGDAAYKAFVAFRKANQAAIAAAELDTVGSQKFTWNGSAWAGTGSQGYSTYTFPGGEVLTVSGGGGLVTRTFVGDTFKYEIVSSSSGESVTLGETWGVSEDSVAAFGVVRSRERRWFPAGTWSKTEEGSGPSEFEITYSVENLEFLGTETKDGLDTQSVVTVNESARCASGLDALRDAFPDVKTLLALQP